MFCGMTLKQNRIVVYADHAIHAIDTLRIARAGNSATCCSSLFELAVSEHAKPCNFPLCQHGIACTT